MGITLSHPKIRRWRMEEDALLGTDTDKAIAARTGHHHTNVATCRAKLGIAAYGRRRP
jgi:hypothetical protein